MFNNATLALLLTLQTPQPPAPAPAASCTAPPHRQFDFWVGNWDVYRTGTDRLIAHSFIERRYAGCAIRENWMPLAGEGGGSFSAYQPGESGWRQIWTDSSGSWVEFRGGLEDGAMVLTGTWPGAAGPGSRPLVKMRYTRAADGSVRQQGAQSLDGGTTWNPSFDLTYRPAATTSRP